MNKILKPIMDVQLVDRDLLKANDYNPNKVLKSNLELLLQSILNNGWTQPIVVRPDMTIIDGFHRWMLSGQEPLKTKIGGKVPVVIVDHAEEKDDIYGTITHNRARGTHLLEPMEAIVRKLLDKDVPIIEIAKQLGMKKEEIWRLSGLDREDFLNFIVKERKYSKETVFTRA